MTVRKRKEASKQPVAEMAKGTAASRAAKRPLGKQDQSTADEHLSHKRRRSKMYLVTLVFVMLVISVPLALRYLAERPGAHTGPPARNATTANSASNGTYSHEPKEATNATSIARLPPRVTKLGHFELLETVPHDPSAFTQGLFVWNNTHMYEGTGNYGESNVRIVDIGTGEVLKQSSLESNLFGEGITPYPVMLADGSAVDHIVQLTYKEQTGIIWDMDLNMLDTFTYDTTTSEGWGITYAKPYGLLVSDGSEWIMVWDPDSLTSERHVQAKRRFPVQLLFKDADTPQVLARVNEMEWDTHTNSLLANIWIQDVLVRIDVESGFVTQIYDMQELWPERPSNVDVFNGIAITDEPNVVWVTGKWWPNMYKVRLID